MKWSLRVKILLSVGIIIFLVLGISTLVHIQDLKRNYLEAIEWRSETMAEGMIESAVFIKSMSPSADFDQALKSFSPICNRLYDANKEKNVAHVGVISPSGVFVAHSNIDFWDTPVESPVLLEAFQQQELTTVLDETTYHTLVPIFGVLDTYVGAIDIGVPKTIVDQKVQQILLYTAELFGGFLLLTFLAISVLMHVLVTKPINRLVTIGEKIAKGELNHKILPEKAEATIRRRRKRSLDEIGRLTLAFHDMMAYLQDMSRAATHIATGDLSQEIIPRSKHDMLGTAFQNMSVYLKTILKEVDGLVRAVQEGKLSHRSNAEAFTGEWRNLVLGLNNVIDALVSPITVAVEYLDRIAKGDIPDKLSGEYKGDFRAMENNLNRLIETIKELLQETNGLIQAIRDGRLDARGEAEAFEGNWQELVVGINHVINAFVIPLVMTAFSIDQIAKGDIPEKITEEYQGDFNEIKNNLNLLIDSMNAITQLAEEMADGDLTVEVKERSDRDTLMRALNMMIQQLNEVVIRVKAAADNVAINSKKLNAQSDTLSNGASQQAAATEEALASMEQMATNTRQNADNARQTERIARQSAEYAEEGGKVVAETVVAMKQIVQKIAIVEEIATQTRMLSLNATIEAARAREHGKAFSVVASEVRQLSDITKKAAEEINELASSSLEISERAGQMLTTLVPSIHKTAELVQEISAASNEQSTGAQHVNAAIHQLDQVTQQNAAASEEIASTAEELAGQAEQLKQTMQFFKIGEIPSKTTNIIDHSSLLSQSEIPDARSEDERGSEFERD